MGYILFENREEEIQVRPKRTEERREWDLFNFSNSLINDKFWIIVAWTTSWVRLMYMRLYDGTRAVV